MLVFHCTQCYHRRCEPYEKTGSPRPLRNEQGNPAGGAFSCGVPVSIGCRLHAVICQHREPGMQAGSTMHRFPSFPVVSVLGLGHLDDELDGIVLVIRLQPFVKDWNDRLE